MLHRVLLKASVRKQLDALPKQVRLRVVAVLDELALAGIHARNTKKLQQPIGGFRTRIGEYRILFDRDADIIVVHQISKRADAY